MLLVSRRGLHKAGMYLAATVTVGLLALCGRGLSSNARAESGRGQGDAAEASELHQQDPVETIKVAEGQVLYELVGVGINLTPPASAQWDTSLYLKGVDTLFASALENETTALFTFYRATVNLALRSNGPMLIVTRAGTNTLYLNATPNGDFSNADSFRAGAPIQTSVLRQQAIIDTVTQTFSIVDEDKVTSTSVFSIGGTKYRIGRVGDVFRTTRTGHLNAAGASPVGWLGGYSVGAEKTASGAGARE
jgi:hypothetical protein